jgi:hypothetical protein
MNKPLLATLGGLLLSASLTAGAQVVVRLGPPPPRVVETMPPPPEGHSNYVWQPGYHRWDGEHYVWVPGHYVEPPYERAHWVEGHWVERDGGWVWMDGRWEH